MFSQQSRCWIQIQQPAGDQFTFLKGEAMIRFFTLLLCLCAGVGMVHAATGRSPAHARFSRNDEMERPAATGEVWAAQAPTAEAADGAAPVFTGCYMWGGRRDRRSSPFFQWELRLQAGTQTLDNLRLRLTALDPMLQPLARSGEGHWVDIGRLAAGAVVDLSYKLNAPSPSAYRVDLTWQGGEERYFATDRHSLPVPRGDVEDQPQLVVLEPIQNYQERARVAQVGFFLRNDGGVAATGVEVSIDLINSDGQTVKTHTYQPENGTIPPGYAKMQQLNIPQSPRFSTVRIRSRMAEDGASTIDPGVFTDVEDVEVAKVRIGDGRVMAVVRNGLPQTVPQLTIDFDLHDAQGRRLRRVSIPVNNLTSGEYRPITADIAGAEGVAGYQIGMSFGGGGAAPPAAGDDAAGDGGRPQIAVDHLELTILEAHAVEEGLRLRVSLRNRGQDEMRAVRCTIEVLDGAGATAELILSVDQLPAGESYEGTLMAPDIKNLGGLGMSYVTGG